MAEPKWIIEGNRLICQPTPEIQIVCENKNAIVYTAKILRESRWATLGHFPKAEQALDNAWSHIPGLRPSLVDIDNYFRDGTAPIHLF
jgi:hypothetical protein